MWTPGQDPEQELEAADALTNPAEMPVPVEDEPSTVAADGRDRRKVVAIALRIGAVVIAIVVTVYALNHPRPPATAGASSTTAKSTTAAPTTTTPAPTTTTGDQPVADEDTDDPAPSDDPVIATITAYFHFLPDDPDAAWALLTTAMQATFEQYGDGRYRQGWGQVSSVRVSHVYNDGSGTAGVMIDYKYQDGRPDSAAPYLFTVVDEDGRWKISHWMMIGG